MSQTSTDSLCQDSPVYWFMLMEGSKERGDFETAARAKRELERLGIHVAYKPRKRKASRAEEGHCVA